MLSFLSWYLFVTLLGLISFPLAQKMLPALADRGYSLSRAFGVLLWGFLFWLSVSLGLARNTLPGLIGTLLVFLVFSFWRAGGWREPLDWLKHNLRHVITVEVLFLLSFAFLAWMRSYAPDATGTEKPMELAFINATLRSETFPPHDPWLSGYGISYYYFGYVLTAMLAKITFTGGGVAFNLMLSLVFALSAVGAYGLLYNLLCAYWPKPQASADAPPPSVSPAYTGWAALLGPLFLLIVSNLEGFFEVLHRLGVGWTFGPDGSARSDFWAWLNMKELSEPPIQPLGLNLDQFRFWWWWRAARTLHDYDLQNNFKEVIDEFPFFSYLLGDLHPHVLAMPFGLLVVSLALNLYLGGWRGEIDLKWFKIPLHWAGFALGAVVLGGMAFLNTWDFPVYLTIFAFAFLLRRVREEGWSWARAEDLLTFSIPMAAVSLLLYLPFFISFSSQAGGIVPNIVYPTRGIYLWMMFGPLFAAIFGFLLHLRGKPARWDIGFALSLGFIAFLWLLSTLMGFAVANTPIGETFITSQGATDAGQVFLEATLRRLLYGGGLLTLAILLGLVVSYLSGARSQPQEASPESQLQPPLPFVLAMILVGGLLVLGPEFLYLRDGFGTRMNTIFKFYYQAWALWAVAGAFGLVLLIAEGRRLVGAVSQALVWIFVLMGLAYPVFAIPTRIGDLANATPTLDAGAYLERYRPDDVAAIQFLRAQPMGVIVEAVGGSYSEYGRIATNSGQPSVLNWAGHEVQWRGGAEEMGSRDGDIRAIYESPSWERTREMLARYNVRYVIIGDLERSTYHIQEDKFSQLAEVFRSGNTIIYFVP